MRPWNPAWRESIAEKVTPGNVQFLSEFSVPKRSPWHNALVDDFPSATSDEALAEASDASSRTVLVVEDEPVTRLVFCKILEEAGFLVQEAQNGLEAIEHFQSSGKNRIHAVVLDVVMPRLGGEKTLVELRRLDPNLPALVVSGLETKEVQRRFTDSQGLSYLRKPVAPANLVQALEDLLAA